MPSILVVDDCAIDLKLTKRILALMDGVRVLTATSGQEAIDIIDEQPVDVVLTDLRMPVVDGLLLLRRIRKSEVNIPVVMMTAEGSEELAVEALRCGAANYVAKHEMARDLLPICESLLAKRKSQHDQFAANKALKAGRISFEIPSDRGVASQLARHLQTKLVDSLQDDAGLRTRVGVAIEEALLNAVIHGNLEVSSELRLRDDNSYGDLIDQRQVSPPFCDRTVEVIYEWDSEKTTITVRDQGQGFDVDLLPDPTDPANLLKPSGRGVLLMRAFMDEVDFNNRGNEVRLVKYRDDSPPRRVSLSDTAYDEVAEPSDRALKLCSR